MLIPQTPALRLATAEYLTRSRQAAIPWITLNNRAKISSPTSRTTSVSLWAALIRKLSEVTRNDKERIRLQAAVQRKHKESSRRWFSRTYSNSHVQHEKFQLMPVFSSEVRRMARPLPTPQLARHKEKMPMQVHRCQMWASKALVVRIW